MTKAHNSKHPIISSILIALIPVVLLSIANAIVQIQGLGDVPSIIVQAVACAVSVLLGLLIVRATGLSLREVGFRRAEPGRGKLVLYYIPVIVAVLLNFGGGSSTSNVTRIVVLLVFTIIVGINEELYFRGILVRRMRKIGAHKAIVIASVIFGVYHLANAIGGYKQPVYVLLQIVVAFVMGLVFAEIVVITRSLWPVIVFHFAHDFISFLTGQDSSTNLGTAAIVLTVVQLVIYAVCAVVFWKKAGVQQASPAV